MKKKLQVTSIRRSILGGSVFAVLGVAVKIVTGFISVPLTVAYLGTDRLGLWRVAISTLALTTFMHAGLIPHIKTRMAEVYAENDWIRFRDYSSTTIFLAFSMVFIGLLGALCALPVNWNTVFNIHDPLAAKEATPLIMVMIVVTFGGFGSTFIEIIFDARMDLSKPRIYTSIASIAGFLLLVIGIYLRVGLPWLALLANIPGVLKAIPLLIQLIVEDVRIVRPNLSLLPDILKEMVAPSAVCLGISLANLAIFSVPNFVIAKFLGLSEVSTYSISYQLVSSPLMLTSAIMPVFWPPLTVAWKLRKVERLRKLMVLAIVCTAVSLLVFTLGMSIFGRWLIKFWTQGQIDASPGLLTIMGIAVVVQGCNHWLQTFLWSTSELKMLLASNCCGAVLIIILALTLTPIMGLEGVAMAMTIALSLGILIPTSWRVFSKLRTAMDGTEKVVQGAQLS